MVIKNLENKIRLTGIVCTAFLVGCVIISVSSIWTARTMVTDAQKKVYVLDGNVPILVRPTTMERNTRRGSQEPCGDVPPLLLYAGAGRQVYPLYDGESHVLGGRNRTWRSTTRSRRKASTATSFGTSAVFSIFCDSIRFDAAKMEFTYYGRQRIERRSNILMRELVTPDSSSGYPGRRTTRTGCSS